MKERLESLSLEEKRALLKRLLMEKARNLAREHPLSYGQRGLWFIHKLAPETAAYNVALTARVCPHPDLAALERTLARLAERHAALRTAFLERSGEPVQCVMPPAPVHIATVDAPAAEDVLRAAVIAEYRRPFRLDEPPLRVVYFRSPQESGILLLVMHHLIVDGWSLQILFQDLRTLYEAELRGTAAEFPSAPAEYSDYVAWQTHMIEQPEAGSLRDYWAEVLSGELPVLRFASTGTHTSRRGLVPIVFTRGLSDSLRELARANQTTLFTVALAALQVLLHRYSGQDDILIGIPVLGRTQPRWMDVVGYFINMLPIRANMAGNPPFAERLARTRGTVLEALDHQDLPFPLMLQSLRRDSVSAPVLQVMFNLVTSPRAVELSRLFVSHPGAPDVPFGDVTFHPYPIPQQEELFDLVVDMTEADGILAAGLKYRSELLDRETAERMAQDYHVLLESVAGERDELTI